MPIPDYQTLMLPVLRRAANGEAKISDVIEEVSDEFNLTHDEKAQLLPSGKQTVIANRTHWAKTYLKQAGLVEATRRAHFRITDAGQELLNTNPTRVSNDTLERYPDFLSFKNRSGTLSKKATGGASEPEDDKTPDEVMRAAHADIETALREDLLDRVLTSTPAFFEDMLVNLLVAMGYGGSVAAAGRALGKSGDGGVDGVIDQDALGLDRVYIQAKRYGKGNNVGSGAIRDFFGSLDRFKANKGLLVTTAEFTADARETAEALSKRIVLIDGDTLTQLMIRYNVGCRIEETLYLRKLDEDFFAD